METTIREHGMLRSLRDLEGYGLDALDGGLGAVKDFYFDDASWVVRYAVVDTRRWLGGRRVLVSPASFKEPDWSRSLIPVALTKDQVRKAPSVEEDRPVSRQHEIDLAQHYAWPAYWVLPHEEPLLTGAPTHAFPDTPVKAKPRSRVKGDPHLRSLNEIVGYDVEALDGAVGSVGDVIVETETWALRYLVVETRKWLPGGRVLVSPEWIEDVQWNDRKIRMDLSEAMIKACPPYHPRHAVNREYEERIYDYYGRPRYWA